MDLEPSAPAASRRVRKKERTRREIFEAAMRLFARDGFGGVTIADICEAADVGRGTFFLHFPTKAALLTEFNQRVAEDFRDGLPTPRGSARAELEALVLRMSVELVAEAEIMTAMLAEFFVSPEALASAPPCRSSWGRSSSAARSSGSSAGRSTRGSPGRRSSPRRRRSSAVACSARPTTWAPRS